jgi:hypothetical protein
MPIPTETLPPNYMQGASINNRVTSSARPWLTLVAQADPGFNADKHREIEYEFSGRWFYADRSKRGAYASY